MATIREAVAFSTFNPATGQRPGQGWVARGDQQMGVSRPIQIDSLNDSIPSTKMPKLQSMIRRSRGLRPHTDSAALVARPQPEAQSMARLIKLYSQSAALLLDPSWTNKQTVQKTFDRAALEILQRGGQLPILSAFVERGITSAQVVAGLQKRYALISRSEEVPGPSLNLRSNVVPDQNPKPAPQLDGLGNSRQSSGLTVRSAVRATMGLR